MVPAGGGTGLNDECRRWSAGTKPAVDGSAGTELLRWPKSNALVRSPQTDRRQAGMCGSGTPKRRSMNRMTNVASNTSEQTQPPRLHGEITSIGTRGPRPYGLVTNPVAPGKSSRSVETVEPPAAGPDAGNGGTRWSKNPSFSS